MGAKANLHTTTANKFIFGGLMEKLIPNKPLLSDEAIAVGLEKHELKYRDHPDDPLNVKNINETYTPRGKGTKQDPFIIPSHEKSRLCKVDLGDEDFDLPEFTVTLEGAAGVRCPGPTTSSTTTPSGPSSRPTSDFHGNQPSTVVVTTTNQKVFVSFPSILKYL